VGDKTDAPALISPLCTKGDMTRFLKENGNADRLEMVSHFDISFAVSSFCIKAVGIAKGLRYLHLKDIIHGDLKPVSSLRLLATGYRTALSNHLDEHPCQ
jgi:serine/threonine protein kinase